MLPKDYVRLRLCGEKAIDVADASGTLLFDVAHRRWSDEVLTALDIPREWLPRVLESPEVSGTTSDGVPVAAGAGDQAAGAVGVGVVEPGPASVVLGTSGVVFSALEAYKADPEARVHVFCHAVPEVWHAMGVMLSAAGSLQWFHDRLAADTPYGELVEEASKWEPGAEGLVVPARTWPASAPRTPIPTRGARSRGFRSAMTAARWCARCSRASPSGCATASTSCRASAPRRRWPARPAAGRATSCG